MGYPHGSGAPAPSNPPTIEARRHAEIVESLWRISTGIEALNQTSSQISRQIADSIARTEAALQFVARTWQEASGKRRARG